MTPFELFLPFLPLAASVNVTWIPPVQSLTNNLTFALNGMGTNGFIYNTSTLTANTTYNWCNMPHVAPSTYPAPDPSRYKLEYVEIVHRHHKRTPYLANTFPSEDTGWDCSGAEIYGYAGDGVVRVKTKIYQDPLNPLSARGYTPTSCAFPQLTADGLSDARQHGRDLSTVYHSLLNFLPSSPNSTLTTFRVTNNIITSQVAGALLSGLYPSLSSSSDFSVLQQPTSTDSLEPAYSCPPASALRTSYTTARANSTWNTHLTLSQSLFDSLDSVSGAAGDSGFHVSFDHYFDDLSARLCHGKPLPCNTTTECISEEDAEEVFRLGQWEYSYLYRDAGADTLAYSTMVMGVWLSELAAHINAVLNGDCDAVRYRHNIAHDGSMAALLGALQVESMVWPGMGAEIVFEVWRDAEGDDGSEWKVRVLWGGRIMRSSVLGELDMVPVERVLGYVEELVGEGAEKVLSGCGYIVSREFEGGLLWTKP